MPGQNSYYGKSAPCGKSVIEKADTIFESRSIRSARMLPGPAAVYAGLSPAGSHRSLGCHHFSCLVCHHSGLVFRHGQVHTRGHQHLVDDVDHTIRCVDVLHGDSGVLDHDLAVADGDVQAFTGERLQRRHVPSLVPATKESTEDIED